MQKNLKITSCPWIISLSTKCDPTNPAPPVTKIRLRFPSGKNITGGCFSFCDLSRAANRLFSSSTSFVVSPNVPAS